MPTVLISSPHPIPWYRHFPDGEPLWEGWHFLFNDPGDNGYDYLVAFDDLHAPIIPRCPAENTVNIATEPISVVRYDPRFTNQFGLCLTLDPEITHPHSIPMQPGMNWFVGWDPETGAARGALSFRELEALFDEPRDKLVSVIASNKTFTKGQRRRLKFAQRLKAHFGDKIDFFGRGFVPMRDKLDALRRYRFHIVLENTKLDHYFTEKIADCIIAGCYPLYYGCPNLEEYLPGDAFCRIEIDDFESSVKVIERVIAGSYDKTRREALHEARRRIMYEHNLFPMLRRVLSAHARGQYGRTVPPARYGPELLPFNHPRFKCRFGPHESQTLRQQISVMVDRYPSLGWVRRVYRSMRRWI